MKLITDEEKIEEVLTRGVAKIYPSKKALKKRMLSGERLRIYQGFDPSTPNLHIGHLVGLLKLKQFQQLGHEVIFLIGDFTGMVGDPTGKIEGARPQLTHQQVLKNAKTYKKQVRRILNFSGKNPIKIKYNSKWLANLGVDKLAGLMRHLTYSQIIKRGMFQKRMEKGKDILLSEFFYPFMQAYDSVHMDVDLEIGGSDQMFNMLVGRQLMKKLKNKEKIVLTTELLVDSKGKKIGKTEGNVINLDTLPNQLFGQIMSLTDDCVLPCFTIITETPMSKIKEIKKAFRVGKNPIQFKKELAFEIVKMLNSQKDAQKAQKEFERVFEQDKEPKKIREVKVSAKRVGILNLLVQLNLVESKNEAKRMVEQGAVKIDGERIVDWKKEIEVKPGMVAQMGKRKFARIHNS